MTNARPLSGFIARFTRLAAAFVVVGLAAGCETFGGGGGDAVSAPATQPAPAAPAAFEYDDAYRIGVGDSLQVNVWRHEDLSINVPVRPDGKISVPLGGDIAVGDRTPEQVSASISEKLAKYVRDPFVTVIVTEMGSNQYRSRVRVTGAVQRPISLPYRQGMTVLDVVLEAGGANEFASLSNASLYRRDGSRQPVRLDRILRRGEMETNYDLRPGDVITVPQSAF
ncbi:MAG: XrtA/PEP-CTERM system exopolysaccharide export protein [Pseudomonadota bacterium]